jgi:uncharacterized protein YtpQ (UPF0354 family)
MKNVRRTSWRSLLLMPKLTRESLRDSCRLALEHSSAGVSATVTPGDPSALEVRTKHGKTLTVRLDNLFADASRAAPEERDRLLLQFVAATIESAEGLVGEQGPSLDQVVPTIKSAEWIDWVPTKDLASEHLVADLFVVYAFDRPGSMQYARWSELERFGPSRTELRQMALSNLRARIPTQLGMRGDDKSFLLIAGGNCEASLILLDEVWEKLGSSISDDIVVCVLARDICLVTANGVSSGLESLVAARDRCCAHGMPSNFISKTLLRRRGKEWIRLQETSRAE